MKIDIGIVNYHSASDTLGAVDHLGAWPHGEVWVVDNSTDADEAGALERAALQRPWMRVLVAERNLGFGQACNRIFERSGAPCLLLLNPDARIGADDVLALARHLQDHPRVGAVSPRIFLDAARRFVLPEATDQSPWSGLCQTLSTRWPRLALWRAAKLAQRTRVRMDGPAAFEVRTLAGAVLMVRRDAVQAAGGLFDPRYFMFFEDADLSLRLRRAGFRLAMLPPASAVHGYRHKAFKAELMEASRRQFMSARHPWFFRLTGRLVRLDALNRAVPLTAYPRVLPEPLHAAADLARETRGAGVLAISASPLGDPAAVRPRSTEPAPLTDAEWDLLEPGDYLALLQTAPGSRGAVWLRFTRAAGRDRAGPKM